LAETQRYLAATNPLSPNLGATEYIPQPPPESWRTWFIKKAIAIMGEGSTAMFQPKYLGGNNDLTQHDGTKL